MPSYNSKKTAKEGDWNSQSLFFCQGLKFMTSQQSKHIISPATFDVFTTTLSEEVISYPVRVADVHTTPTFDVCTTSSVK